MINYTTTPFSDEMSEDDTIPLDDSDAETPGLSTTGYESCSSSSGDEDSDRCSICLLRLKLQPLGRPEHCKHLFCLECITQWAKVCVKLGVYEASTSDSLFQLTPSCPIDRVDFRKIFYRDQLSCSETGHRDVVKDKPVQADVVDVPEETLCEVCQRGDREHILLLCDSCDLAYHTTCLATPLDRVPRGSWYCDLCVRVNPVRPNTRRVREDVITRTGHLERIRGAVTAARRELETRFATFLGNNSPVRTRTRKRTKRTKKKVKSKPKRRRKCQSKISPVKIDKAIVDNVRRALGINDAVYNERPVPLTLFGNYNELDPVADEEEEEETLVGPVASVGPGTRVMPRHVAIERVNLARRRRNKMGLQIADSVSGPVDVLSSIINCQGDLFTRKSTSVTSPKKLSPTKASLKCKSAAMNSTTEEQTASPEQPSVSQPASESPNRSESNVPASENSSGNPSQTEQEETRDNSSPLEDLPPLSAEGLRTLASKSADNASEEKDSLEKRRSSDECDKVKSPKSESSPSSSESPKKTNGESNSPKKKSIIKDIFGSDEEAESNEAGKPDVSDIKENADNYSDVSDKEIEASEEVHRELSVSSINSDQSESFEKAATLEGLNPETISAEEDFTSLSEEEEGEIKTIQRRKELRLKKKELQKKVKELEKQVIDMSPNSAPIDLNGLLEDGEINEDKKNKSAQSKDKGKVKKKKLKGKGGVTEKENPDEKDEKNPNATGRNYRKKKSEDAEDHDESVVSSKTKKNKDKIGKKPELQRYDVRRVLDAKKDKPSSKKNADNDNSKENNLKGKDKFGRDISNKDQPKKRKGGRSRSRSRGRKKRRRSRRRSTSSSSSSSLSLSSSSSSSESSSSSSSSRSRSRNRKSKQRKGNNKKIIIKKKLPLAEKIKNRVRSEDKSKNKKKSKRSVSRSRSRSPKKDKTKLRRKRSRSRSPSRRKDKSKDKSRNKKRSPSRSRSRSVKKKSKNVSDKKKDKPKTKAAKVPEPVDKSVYSSGDKIMISVNFPANSDHVSAKDRLDKDKVSQTKSDQKPSVIIDLLDDEKPYKVIETEKECVDIASDTEKENTQPQAAPSKGPMTPPEPDRYDPFDPTVSPDNEPESLPVDPPLTPPLQPSTPPVESPSPSKAMSSPPNSNTSPGIHLVNTPQKTPASGKKR